jgi:hypothetical protein
MVVVGTEALEPFGDRAGTEIRATGDDDPGRLALGVRVDDMDRRVERHTQ